MYILGAACGRNHKLLVGGVLFHHRALSLPKIVPPCGPEELRQRHQGLFPRDEELDSMPSAEDLPLSWALFAVNYLGCFVVLSLRELN